MFFVAVEIFCSRFASPEVISRKQAIEERCLFNIEWSRDIMETVTFEWDPGKAMTNLRKHNVSFEEAMAALKDPMSATGFDPDHSITEERYITFGTSPRGRLLVVAHTEKDGVVRIISAREAGKRERKVYEEG